MTETLTRSQVSSTEAAPGVSQGVSGLLVAALSLGAVSVVFGLVSMLVWVANVGPLAGSGRLYSSMFLVAAPLSIVGVALASVVGKRSRLRSVALTLSLIGCALAFAGGFNVIHTLFSLS